MSIPEYHNIVQMILNEDLNNTEHSKMTLYMKTVPLYFDYLSKRLSNIDMKKLIEWLPEDGLTDNIIKKRSDEHNELLDLFSDCADSITAIRNIYKSMNLVNKPKGRRNSSEIIANISRVIIVHKKILEQYISQVNIPTYNYNGKIMSMFQLMGIDEKMREVYVKIRELYNEDIDINPDPEMF